MNVDIEKMKALALAATPGPWQWWTSNSTLRLTGANGKDGGVLHGYVHSGVGDVSCNDANRAFIEAANPSAVLELIAEVERLRADLKTATGEAWKANAALTNLKAAAPASGTEKDAERYRVLRSYVAPSDVCLSMGVPMRPLLEGESIEERIDALCDSAIERAAIAAHTKAGEPA